MADDKLAVKNKISVGGGLHGRIAAAEKMKELSPFTDARTMPNRLAIVADFSGSMAEPAAGRHVRWDDESTPKSKLDLLKEAVQDFAFKSNPNDTAIAVESFPKGFRIDLTTNQSEVYLRMTGATTLGDTPMGVGLSNALELHSPTRAMLISDGEQTDDDAPFEQARKYKQREIIIDCVHIGKSTRGEETLRRIAEITGGLYIKFTDVTSFAQNFHWLLPESRTQIAGMLPEQVQRLLGSDEVR